MAKGDIRKGSASLKDVFEMMFEDMGLDNKMKEAKVLETIPEVFGEAIMNRIDEYYIYQKKLFIKTNSAPMKHELFLLKDAILQNLNKVIEEAVIVDIILR